MKIITCPECGKRMASTVSTCTDCGTDLSEFHKDPISKRKNSKLVYIVIFITVFLILTVTVTIILLRYKNNKEVNIYNIPVGVYDGDDHEILIIKDDGYANYYCIDDEFTEIACPWIYENNTLKIELARLHCTIEANVRNKDFSELIFKTKSENWNTELFTKIEASTSDYENKKIHSLDDDITINKDGSLSIDISNYIFTAPKKYRSRESDYSTVNDVAILIDNNVDYDFASGILFYTTDNTENVSYNYIAFDFISGFINDPEVNYLDKYKHNDTDIYTYDIRGNMNSGFSGLKGYYTIGKLAIIPDTKTDKLIFILLMQTQNEYCDNTEDFLDMISNFKHISN